MFFKDLEIGEHFCDDKSGDKFVKVSYSTDNALAWNSLQTFRTFLPDDEVTFLFTTKSSRVGKSYKVVRTDNSNLIIGWKVGKVIHIENIYDAFRYTVNYVGAPYDACDNLASEELIATCCEEVSDKTDLDKVFSLANEKGVICTSDLYKLFPERLIKGKHFVVDPLQWLYDIPCNSSLYSFKALVMAKQFTITGWSDSAGGFITDVLFMDDNTYEDEYACITPESLSRYCKPLESD